MSFQSSRATNTDEIETSNGGLSLLQLFVFILSAHVPVPKNSFTEAIVGFFKVVLMGEQCNCKKEK